MGTGIAVVKESQNSKSFKDARLYDISFGCYITKNLFKFLDMRNTDFTGAELNNVNFNYCDLRGAKFDGAKFNNVTFYYCLFDVVKTKDFLEIAQFFKDGIRTNWYYMLREEGYAGSFCSEDMSYPVETDGEELTGYKKVWLKYGRYGIAKLRIPVYADRIVYRNDKCRASCAQVVDIYDESGRQYDVGTSMSFGKGDFKYNLGHMVYADGFDDDPFEVCSHGIHFFLTEQEAWDYFG